MLFQKTVYEPMILSLNVSDTAMTKYVEFIIPKRDLLAMFIFEVRQRLFFLSRFDLDILLSKDTDDMELFIKECHEKQKLVVHGSAIPSMSVDDFRREATSIGDLKRYDMFQYVLDTIQGPDAILRYLCQTTKAHMIPIANESAMSRIDEITKDSRIRRFFVKNFCVSSSLDQRRSATFVSLLVHSLEFLLHERTLDNERSCSQREISHR